jgi:hypothetical protein
LRCNAQEVNAMADFTLSSGSIARPYRSPWGAFPIRHMPLSSGVSSNAILVGRVVGLDVTTDTNASQIVASSQTAGVVMSTAIVGQPGSTNTRGTEIPVWEANPMIEFRAQTQGANLASSQVGKTKALVWDSTLTIHKVDLSNSTLLNVRVVVTELIDAEGDSGGAVAFKFLRETPPAGDSTSSRSVLAFHR